MLEQETIRTLLEISRGQQELLGRLPASAHDAKERKDIWDKLSSISTFLASVVIAGISLILTQVYNDRQGTREHDIKKREASISATQTLHTFASELFSDSQLQQAFALRAIRATGQSDIAISMAGLIAQPGSTSEALNFLLVLAQTGTDEERKLATEELRRLAEVGKLAEQAKQMLAHGPVTRDGVRNALALFRFDRTSETNLKEAELMLKFIGAGSIETSGPTSVSGTLPSGPEVTVWINS